MGDRRYGVGTWGGPRSPRHPSPRSRDYNPSKHRKYSPDNRRGREQYSREADTLRRVDKRDHLERDSALRFAEYDNRGRDRDRDKYVVGGRQYRSRSPHIIKKRDSFDRDYKDKAAVGGTSSCYKDSYRGGDSSLTKLNQVGHLLDGPRKSDHLELKDYSSHTRDYNGVGDTKVFSGAVGKRDYYSHTRDYNGVGGTKVTSGGVSGERDYYPSNHYSDSAKVGLSSVSHYLDRVKPFPLEYERGRIMDSRSYRLGDGGVDNMPGSNFHSGDGSSSHVPLVSSRYLNNTVTEKYGDELRSEKIYGGLPDREVRYFENKKDAFNPKDGFSSIEKSVGREMYKFKKEDDLISSQGYLKGDSDYMVPSSSSYQPKDYVSVSSGILKEGFKSSYSATGELTNMPSDVTRRRSELASQPIGFDRYSDEKQNTYQLDDTRSSSRLYAEFGRSKIGSMSTTRINEVENKYKDDFVYPSPYHFTPNEYEGLSNQHVKTTSDKFDVKKRDLDMLGNESSLLKYGTKEYVGIYGRDRSEVRRFERSDMLQSKNEYDPSFSRHYDSPRNRVTGPYEKRLGHKHARDELLSEFDAGIRISTDRNGARKIYNQVNAGDERDLVNLPKKPKYSKSTYEDNDRPSSSKRRSVKTRLSDSRNLKNRLGPLPRKLHVSQRLVRKDKPSIKKRLGKAPINKRATLQWVKMKNLTFDRTTSSQDDSDGGAHLEDHLPLAKTEPPENSRDFKQLAKSAFLKFLKQINETPAKRKMYMEGGEAGSLKCIVCGRDSDEFVETESLAMHAFTSKKDGLRSQHLGLHKALCVLMGWKIPEDSSSEWQCEPMSSAESSSLKEDIIIWPPVVIVHNSTVDNKNPDEKAVLSIDELHTKLRDMGFQSILKVCNRKPENQSMMVVKFNGTLSGLQEAERLHRNYVQSDGATRAIISSEREEKEEDNLYGHLGIAEDLDKLDSDTKKRCVLKSKNEILSIVD